jgi:hypothetical protein
MNHGHIHCSKDPTNPVTKTHLMQLRYYKMANDECKCICPTCSGYQTFRAVVVQRQPRLEQIVTERVMTVVLWQCGGCGAMTDRRSLEIIENNSELDFPEDEEIVQSVQRFN